MTILGIVRAGFRLGALEFGQPLDVARDREAHLRWVLEDWDARRDELWNVAPPAAVEILLRLLDEAGEQPRRLVPALRALGWIALRAAAPALSKRLPHPDPEVRRAALHGLGQIGLYTLADVVRPFLDDPDPEVRVEALFALGKVGTEYELERMRQAAGGSARLQKMVEDSKRRMAAMFDGDKEGFALAVLQSEDYEDLVPVTAVMGETLVAVLADRARPAQERMRAARLLALGRAREAREQILPIALDPAEPLELRVQAVQALGIFQSKAAVGPLLELLQSPEPALQEAAVESLGRIGEGRALEPLLDCWDARGGALRGRIRAAARRLCRRQGADVLRGALVDEQEGPFSLALFGPGEGELVRGYRADRVHPLVVGPDTAVRREALLCVAVFGERAETARLAEAVENDPDDENRWLAAIGHQRLVRAVRRP